MSHFWSPDQLAITIGAVVVLVLVVFVLLASRKRVAGKVDSQLADDLAKGDYEAAAERELKAGRLQAAYDLFLRAKQPLRAANIAARQGRTKDAAELFEKAGVRNRAADLYRQLGMTAKADELLAEDAKAARVREEEREVLRQKLGDDFDDDEGVPIVKPAPAARVLADAAKTGATPSPVKVSALSPSKPEPKPRPAVANDGVVRAPVEKAAEQGRSPVLTSATTQASQASLDARPQVLVPPSPVAATPAAAAGPRSSSAIKALRFDDAKPVLQEPSFGEAKSATPLLLDEPAPKLQEPSFGDAKAATETLSFGAAPGGTSSVAFSLDEAESGPVASVEALPQPIPPESNLTPRTPAVKAGTSVGTYRMVHPSQADVFTPPPSDRTPVPDRKSGEHRPLPPQKTPTPRPTLRMGTKGSGERRTGGTPVPGTARTPVPGAPNPRTSTPAPRSAASGSHPILGDEPKRK